MFGLVVIQDSSVHKVKLNNLDKFKFDLTFFFSKLGVLRSYSVATL